MDKELIQYFKFKEYTDGKRVIYATEEAYESIYKQQGFKPKKKSVKGE